MPSWAAVRVKIKTDESRRAALTDTAHFRENSDPTAVATPPAGRRDDDQFSVVGIG
jgi:hypothetical protein